MKYKRGIRLEKEMGENLREQTSQDGERTEMESKERNIMF